MSTSGWLQMTLYVVVLLLLAVIWTSMVAPMSASVSR